jgi:ubiquinone/menaquinone biosynthesis C-methylase UbiE
VANDRDVAAFEARAADYESGWLGRMHHDIADRAANLAVSGIHEPKRIMDVGCGTGYLLRRLCDKFPTAEALSGSIRRRA